MAGLDYGGGQYSSVLQRPLASSTFVLHFSITAESPYAHLLDNRLWQEVADLFVRDACALMGLSVESPLAVAVNAGCTALPALLNIKQVSENRYEHYHELIWGILLTFEMKIMANFPSTNIIGNASTCGCMGSKR